MNHWGWGSTYRTSNSEYGQFNHNFGQNQHHLDRRPGQGQGQQGGSVEAAGYYNNNLMPRTSTAGSINHQQSQIQFNAAGTGTAAAGLQGGKAGEETSKMNHSQIPRLVAVNNQKSQMFSTPYIPATTTNVTTTNAENSLEKVDDSHVDIIDEAGAGDQSAGKLLSSQIKEKMKLDEDLNLKSEPVRVTSSSTREIPMLDTTTLTGINSSTTTTTTTAGTKEPAPEDQELNHGQQLDTKLATTSTSTEISQNQPGKIRMMKSPAAGTLGIGPGIAAGGGDNMENSGSKFRLRKKYSDPQPIERKVPPKVVTATARQSSKPKIDSSPKLVRGDYLEKSTVPIFGTGKTGTTGAGSSGDSSHYRIFFKNEKSGSDQKYKLCGKCPKCRSIKSQNLNYNSNSSRSLVGAGTAGPSPGTSWNSSTSPGTLTKSQLSRSKANLRTSLPSTIPTTTGPSLLHLNPSLRR